MFSNFGYIESGGDFLEIVPLAWKPGVLLAVADYNVL